MTYGPNPYGGQQPGNQQPFGANPYAAQPGQPLPGQPQPPAGQPYPGQVPPPQQAWNGAPQQPGQWQQQPPAMAAPQGQPAQTASAVPQPGPKQLAFVEFDLPVTTAEFLPDLDATQVVGMVFGVALRARDLRPAQDNVATLVGARQDAVAAMVAMAKEAGAEAVVGVHFDTAPVSEGALEVCAYGTAVLTEAAVTLSEADIQALTGEQPDRPATTDGAEPQLGQPAPDRPALGSQDVQTLANLTDNDEGEPIRQLGEPAPSEARPEDLPQPPTFGGWAAENK